MSGLVSTLALILILMREFWNCQAEGLWFTPAGESHHEAGLLLKAVQ